MAEIVWRQHFPGIISEKQIDYMLARLYSLEVMSAELESGQVDYRFILHDGNRVGFCAFGSAEHPEEMKVHKLYILPHYQRHGYGSWALRCIEELCMECGVTNMTLAVNKRNSSAIHAYERRGFIIEESVTVDIGGGFIMDDYIMRKKLA
jgi:ribosomal protein S18 acetylase RimI-like enzyme